MPKKKKKKDGKKKAKGGDKEKPKDVPQKPYEPPGPSDKELTLKRELDEVNLELDTLKKQVEDLRQENEWLQKEAEETKQETHDYQTFISRKADKRQSMIISLSDYNQKQLKDIAQEREELIRDYEEKKAELNATLLEKENELSKIQEELKTLEPFKALQEEQDAEIRQLEQQMEEEKFAHETKIRTIKVEFLKNKRALEESSEARVREMANIANKQAAEFLKRHTQHIKVENHQLRKELQDLIDVTNALQLQKKKLEKQYSDLLREHQFSQNLQMLRGSVFRGGEVGSQIDLGSVSSDIGLPQLRRR